MHIILTHIHWKWGHMQQITRTHVVNHEDTFRNPWEHMQSQWGHMQQIMRTHASNHEDTFSKPWEHMQFQHVSTCKETQITHMQRNLIKTHINNAPNSGALRQCFFLTNSEVPFLESGKTHRSCRDHEVCTRVSAAGGRVSAGRQAGIKKNKCKQKKNKCKQIKTNASKW